jgi:fumarate reductase flavoprotein subunit
MATEVGADLTGMGFVQMIPAFDILVPAENFIYVNSDAERYVNEYSTRDVLSAATLEQTGSVWALFDSAQAATNNASLSLEEIDKTYVETGRVLQAETLDELAELMGVDASALKETVEKYNSFVDTGVDTDLGKQTFGLKIQEGPFYASPVKVQVHHTMGGVTINTDTQVLDASGNVIPGLYAAGEVTGGIHGGNRVGGNALADCFTFGRIAGTNAAKH